MSAQHGLAKISSLAQAAGGKFEFGIQAELDDRSFAKIPPAEYHHSIYIKAKSNHKAKIRSSTIPRDKSINIHNR